MSKRHFLEFEQPIAELDAKIEELRYVQNESAVDISEEIGRLDQKTQLLTKEIYSRLSPWQVTQIARHPQRPYTLDAVHMALPSRESDRDGGLEDTQPGIAPRIKRGQRPSRDELHEVLERCEWNVSAAARELGRDRKQIYRWAALHGIVLKEE